MPMTHLRRYRLRVSIPDAVRATILQRMRRMTDFDRAVVMHASVIGRWFDFAVLVETAAGPEDEVRTALERACSLDLVIAEAEPHGAYAFRHALTRDIIYTELLTLAVRPIHGRIARALERAPHRAARLEQLAYHSWAAGDVRRCVKYNELAGRRCGRDSGARRRTKLLFPCPQPHRHGVAGGETTRSQVASRRRRRRGRRALGKLSEYVDFGALTVRDDHAIGLARLVFDPRDLRDAVLLAKRQRIEAAWRRTENLFPIEFVFRAMAGTDKLSRVGMPLHVAAEVRANRAKDHETRGNDGVGDGRTRFREQFRSRGDERVLRISVESDSQTKRSSCAGGK
jgi:hypothetical protein